jgi:Transglutaminase-like superfamily
MLNKLTKLSFLEIYYLFMAFLLLSICKTAIKLLPFNYLQTKYQSLTATKNTANYSQAEISAKALAINRIAKIFSFLGFSCLPKAMAFKYWLRKIPDLKLHFGVQKDPKNQLIAHAWVTEANKTILGADATTNYQSIWVWG